MIIKAIVPIIAVAALFFLAEKTGFAITLGAHPFWATKVTYFGIGIGAALSAIAMTIMHRIGTRSFVVPLTFLVITGIIAAITLLYGKAEFAASYAENAFAGRVWYIGFMGLLGGVFTTLVLAWHTLSKWQVAK